MTNLERSAKKDTVGMIITILMYGVGVASIPSSWIAGLFSSAKEIEWLVAFALKMLCAILPLYLINQFGFGKTLRLDKGKLRSSMLTIPALLVMVNNLPFVPVIMGDMSINGTFFQFFTYILGQFFLIFQHFIGLFLY